MPKKTVLVAFGGVSPEHEVAVLTAMQAIQALPTDFQTIPLYIAKSGKWFTGEVLLDLEQYKDLPALEKKAAPCTLARNDAGQAVLMETRSAFWSKPRTHPVHIVLPAFHGADGENGAFQGICELFGLPYAGSGVMGSALGMNKYAAKQICRANGFPVVPDVAFFEPEWSERRDEILDRCSELSFPLYVKPVSLGSSIGVARVTDRQSLILAVETAFRYDQHIIVEKAIHPLREINCSVLGSPDQCKASVLEQPVGSDTFLSFQDKYQRGDAAKGMASADRLIPAPIDVEKTGQIRALACKIFTALECSGVARLDFLLNDTSGEVFFNEINTIPGSFSFYLWDKSDMNFTELLAEILHIAEERHRRQTGRVRSYETNLLSEKAARGIKGLKGTKAR